MHFAVALSAVYFVYIGALASVLQHSTRKEKRLYQPKWDKNLIRTVRMGKGMVKEMAAKKLLSLLSYKKLVLQRHMSHRGSEFTSLPGSIGLIILNTFTLTSINSHYLYYLHVLELMSMQTHCQIRCIPYLLPFLICTVPNYTYM